MKIGVVGCGSWGTALACLLNTNGHLVTLWGNNKENINSMIETRKNLKYLPEKHIDENIILTCDDNLLQNQDMIILAVPSNAIRNVCERFKNLFNDGRIIVNVAKGIEQNSLLRLSQVIQEVIPNSKVAVLYGPSHAEEVAKGLATACVASSENIETAKKVQDAFMNNYFRVYTNSDVIGVEIGGAIKNIIALAAGASDGCGFGDNAKAALITRGIAEISRLGVAMGANKETFSGLTGLGDLIVTCTSSHSRNHRAGFLMGQGKNLEQTLNSINMVVEGVNSAKAVNCLAQKYNVNMPIIKEINNVLFENKTPKEAVISLMSRTKTDEKQEHNLL